LQQQANKSQPSSLKMAHLECPPTYQKKGTPSGPTTNQPDTKRIAIPNTMQLQYSPMKVKDLIEAVDIYI
jgi:hypothetical protein